MKPTLLPHEDPEPVHVAQPTGEFREMAHALYPADPRSKVARVVRVFGHLVCAIRPLHAGDEPRLVEFFASHTPETVHARYGYIFTTMTPDRAAQLVNVDQTRDCALGIFEQRPEGEILHAVGRYCLDANATGAEVAFVVRETTRRHGMATLLLRLLIATARARGLHRLWAQVESQNEPMLRIFRRLHFAVTPASGDGPAALYAIGRLA